jgi:hypothetical protein
MVIPEKRSPSAGSVNRSMRWNRISTWLGKHPVAFEIQRQQAGAGGILERLQQLRFRAQHVA